MTIGFSDIAASTVRVMNVRRGRYVEFEYSLSDALLCVELIMPYPAFREFCQSTKAKMLPTEKAAAEAYRALAESHDGLKRA